MSSAPDISTQPGLILRTAREELGLSLDHVAHELHLRVSVVQSLETEDYSAFSSDVFLKGYFRSYCRLVNLHEERMVELLEKQLLSIKQEHDDQAANVKKAAQAKVRKKAAILVVLLAVVSSALIYIFSLFGGSNDVLGTDVQSLKESLLNSQIKDGVVQNVIEGGEYSENGDDASGLGSRSDKDPSKFVKQDNVKKDISNGSEDNKQLSASIGNMSEDKRLEKSKLESKSVETIPEKTKQSIDSSLDISVEDTPIAMVQDSEILIQFSGDCWLKFTSGEGKTVFAALKRDGQQVKYIGKAPFSIVLGDARKSIVTFNGEVVDLEQYTRKNGRAQFVLEPKS